MKKVIMLNGEKVPEKNVKVSRQANESLVKSNQRDVMTTSSGDG